MEALDRISSELDELLASGLDPADEAEAMAMAEQVESIGRKADALRVEALDVSIGGVCIAGTGTSRPR